MFTKVIRDGLDVRLVEDHHVPALYELVRRNLDHLRPWMPWATDDYSLEGCRASRRAALEQFARNDGFDAGIFEDGQIVGMIGFHGIDWRHRRTSIGYWLSADRQGRGIVTAACRTLIDHALVTLDLNRVEIQCATENTRSRQIPQRLGFTEEGVLRQCDWVCGRYLDHVVYGMLAEEWRDRTSG